MKYVHRYAIYLNTVERPTAPFKLMSNWLGVEGILPSSTDLLIMGYRTSLVVKLDLGS
jgi:hypothetical protein